MKDIVIAGRHIVRESMIFGGCVLAAFAINIYSIIHFKTAWKELFTTLPITLAIALVLFVCLFVLRGIELCARHIFRRKTAA